MKKTSTFVLISVLWLILTAIMVVTAVKANSEVTPWFDVSFGTSLYGDYLIGKSMLGIDLWGKMNNLGWKNKNYGLSVYVSYETYMQEEIPSFHPWNDIYTMGAKLVVGSIYVSIEHWCSHEVVSGIEPKKEYLIPYGQNTTVMAGIRFPLDRPLW